MAVVAGQMGMDTVLLEQLGHGVVIGFHRSPGAMEKIVPPRVQLPSGRHAGHAAHITGIEHSAFFRQPLKVGGLHPIAAIGRQKPPVQ